MKTIYESNDGKQFENEKDCLDYEKRAEKEYDFSEIVFLGRNGKIYKVENEADSHKVCAGIHYFLVKSEKDYNKVKTMYENAGYYDTFPEYNKNYEGKEAIYAYGYEEDSWVDFKAFYEKMKEDYKNTWKMFKEKHWQN